MAFMFVLRCVDNTFFIESAESLKTCLMKHKSGVGNEYTSKRLPVALVYCEYYSNLDEAKHRQSEVCEWHKTQIEKLICGSGMINVASDNSIEQILVPSFGGIPYCKKSGLKYGK